MLGCLIIAAIFWFNPLISSIDILPDIVGYLLVIKAFSRQAYVYDYADSLCSSAKKMCVASGVKLFSIVFVSSFDPTMSLLLSFCFALIEAIFGIPFFIKLFTAYSNMAGKENALVQANESKVKGFTIAAFLARLVLGVLPDLTALSLNNAFITSMDFTYLRFRPLFIGFAFIVALSICIPWLISYIKYIRKAITKEAVLQSGTLYQDLASNKKSIFLAKYNIRAVIAIAIGSLFIFDFTWEYISVDIFQDFMFPLITVLALIYLFIKGVYKVNKKFLLLACALMLHIGAGIFEIIANKRYFVKYNLASVLKVSEAESMYFTVCFSAIISAIMMFVSCFVILTVMKDNARTSIVQHKDLFSQSDIEYYLKEFERRTRKNITITTVFSALSCIMYCLMVIFKPYAEWTILLDIVFQILFIISVVNSILYIHDEVYKRILSFS